MTTPCSLCAWDRTRNWVGDARAWRAYTFVGYVSQRHDYGLGVISEHPMPTSFCRRHQSQRCIRQALLETKMRAINHFHPQILTNLPLEIDRASCRERVCQYV